MSQEFPSQSQMMVKEEKTSISCALVIEQAKKSSKFEFHIFPLVLSHFQPFVPSTQKTSENQEQS